MAAARRRPRANPRKHDVERIGDLAAIAGA
jgi:hypothetical protein